MCPATLCCESNPLSCRTNLPVCEPGLGQLFALPVGDQTSWAQTSWAPNCVQKAHGGEFKLRKIWSSFCRPSNLSKIYLTRVLSPLKGKSAKTGWPANRFDSPAREPRFQVWSLGLPPKPDLFDFLAATANPAQADCRELGRHGGKLGLDMARKWPKDGLEASTASN